MLAVLQDMGLEKYIEKTAVSPIPVDSTKPTNDEVDAMDKWKEGDAKARTRIELAIGDVEMIHVSGATTARDMWDQLTMVKESKGQLGVLATRRALYRATAEEGFEMVTHISKLRQLRRTAHHGQFSKRRRLRDDTTHLTAGILGQLHDFAFWIEWKQAEHQIARTG